MHRMTFAVAVSVLVGCASAPADNASRADIAAVTKSWESAFNDCSPERLAALYHPDAVLWGTVAQTIISTPAGVRQYFDRACAAKQPFKVAIGEQFIRVYGDTAVNSGTYTFSRTVDGQLRSGGARYSFTYRKVSGTWIIADHHSSLIPAAPPASPPASPLPSR